jgi:hypothetical protein
MFLLVSVYLIPTHLVEPKKAAVMGFWFVGKRKRATPNYQAPALPGNPNEGPTHTGGITVNVNAL